MIPRESPWCSGFCGRVTGTLRREGVDHVIPLGAPQLARLPRESRESCNSQRCHQALDGDAPISRPQGMRDDDNVQAEPVLAGMHNVHSRAA